MDGSALHLLRHDATAPKVGPPKCTVQSVLFRIAGSVSTWFSCPAFRDKPMCCPVNRTPPFSGSASSTRNQHHLRRLVYLSKLKTLRVVGRIILKRIFKKQIGFFCRYLAHMILVPLEILGSTNGEEFLEYLSSYQLLKGILLLESSLCVPLKLTGQD
jgi:hypothetical protein